RPACRLRAVQRMSAAGARAADEARLGVGAPIQDTRGDKIALACIYTALAFFCIAVLYPLIYVISASVSNTHKVSAGEVWLWPVGLTLDAYKAIFDYKAIVSGVGSSV